MGPRRWVVDTNVLISALLQPAGTAAMAVDTMRSEAAVLIFSDSTFDELASRLMRTKFDRYIDVALRQQFLSDLASVGEWVVIKGHLRACRDPDDDKFLETALAGEAPCIVTGDADLLALDPFQGVRVLTPRRFVEFSQSLPGSLSP